jgi:error-prone DNA polymerase
MMARFLSVRGRLQRAGLVIHVVAESFVDLSAELSSLRDGKLYSAASSSAPHPDSNSLLIKSRDFH